MFFDNSRADRKKRADKKAGVFGRLNLENSPVPPAKTYQLMTMDELYSSVDRTFVFDTESFVNYWLIAFKCVDTGKIIYLEDSPNSKINTNVLGFILHRFRLIGFNSKDYDLITIGGALMGLPAWKLKTISDQIIKSGERAYEIEKQYGFKAVRCNHIDLIQVAPLQAPLKIYGGRLHCERMQDLPYPVDTELSEAQAINVRDYCINDLDITHDLFNHLEPHIGLRELLGIEYDTDLRSKSDAQVAEAIIRIELERAGADIGKKPEFEYGMQFNYIPPPYINFKTKAFQHAFDTVCTTPFTIGGGGSADCPEAIDRLLPKLGHNVYKLGVGGLHSSEESISHYSDNDTLIIDRDVASYYPYIILNNGYFPTHIGEIFLKIYREIVLRRLKLKKEKNPLEAGLKIAINGIFGKLGNFYSLVYAPNLLLQVCMTGQLSLMMLIEAIELAGISVASANTDGIVIICPKNKYDILDRVIMEWENTTGFATEETRYRSIHSRDVNNYIAVKEDGTCKMKGFYSTKGSAQNSVLSKNPEAYIVSMAVQEFLSKGTPIPDTVNNNREIANFLSVRTVKGGGEKDGVYLGKAVRWYYAQGETGTINYVGSGNKVPKSEGAKPCMTIYPGFPNDIDFDYYSNEAINQLYKLGVYKRPEAARLI